MERHKDIIIHRKTHSTVTIECNDIIAKELYNFFSAFATNYRWSPLYKARQWDGKIRFFKISTNELPIGLTEKVYEFARKGNYTIECKFKRFNDIDRKEFKKFVDSLNLTRTPRDYQIEAAYQAICKKNLNIQISTRGGKTLVMYIIVRFLVHTKNKTLIVVPNQQLVEQAYEDFESYGWNPEKYCHRIYSGQKKLYDAPVLICCWQSMVSTKVKNDNPYENLDAIIIDENHQGSCKSLVELANVCINAEYRYGFSGTFPEATIADWYSIVGSIGPIQVFATYKSLQDGGYISKLKIYSTIFRYNKEFKYKVYNECGTDYAKQNDMIHNSPERNAFIAKMIQNLDNNCLFLFTKKEKHGLPLYEYLKEHLKNKTILYIDGDVPLQDRKDIVKIMEERNDVVLLGTYGCISVGITISNLHTIIFGSSYKSKTKVFQALGRSLGLHSDKKYAKLIDIIDDCSFINRTDDIRFINHSVNHYKERKQFYLSESWEAKEIIYKI